MVIKIMLSPNLGAKGMASWPTVKNHATAYISLAITPLRKPVRTKVHQGKDPNKVSLEGMCGCDCWQMEFFGIKSIRG